eukprot:1150889-Pelagomonas_calceolata.AAC.4
MAQGIQGKGRSNGKVPRKQGDACCPAHTVLASWRCAQAVSEPNPAALSCCTPSQHMPYQHRKSNFKQSAPS